MKKEPLKAVILYTSWRICWWETDSTREAESTLGWAQSPHTYLDTHTEREEIS